MFVVNITRFKNAIEKMEQTSDMKMQVKQAFDICETYVHATVQSNCPKKINCSASSVRFILEHVKQEWTSNLTPVQAYASLKQTITLELATESFPRFTRSPTFYAFLQTKDGKYIHSISQMKAALHFSYKPSDFSAKSLVTMQDIKFIQSLVVDSYEWELQGYNKVKSSTISAYMSHKQFMPDIPWSCNGGMVVKYVATFPYSMEQCAKYRYSMKYILEEDPNFYKFEMLEYLKKDQLPVDSNSSDTMRAVFQFKLPFPLTTLRQLVYTCSYHYDATNRSILQVLKPVEHGVPKNCYDCKDFHAIYFKELDSGRTLFMEIQYVFQKSNPINSLVC